MEALTLKLEPGQTLKDPLAHYTTMIKRNPQNSFGDDLL